MSTPYAGNPASFPANVRLVDDGEPASAAFLGLCAQDLADRTANLKARLDAQGVGTGAAVVKATSYQVVGEQIINCVGRGGAITITLPATADAPIGRAVLIVEGSNDPTAINISPHAGDTIFTTRTAITFGKDSVLAKKITATEWILIYQSDFDSHAFYTSVTAFEASTTASLAGHLSYLDSVNQNVNGPWVTTADTPGYALAVTDRKLVYNSAFSGAILELPVPTNVGFPVQIITTSLVTLIEVRDNAGSRIMNNGSDAYSMGPEESRLYTWNGFNWIRS